MSSQAHAPTSDFKDLAKEANAIMEAGSLRSSSIGISGVHKPTSPATTIKSKEQCFYYSGLGKDARKCNQLGCKMAHVVLSAPALSFGKRTDQPPKILLLAQQEKTQ